MLKDIHCYLLCLVLNRPVTILGKKLVLNLRLTLCALKNYNFLTFKNFLHLLVTKDMYFYLLMNKDSPYVSDYRIPSRQQFCSNFEF